MPRFSFRAVGLSLLALAVLLSSRAIHAETITFADLTLAPESFNHGPFPNATTMPGPFGPLDVGSFTSGSVEFINRFDPGFGVWDGFAYSNVTDTTTAGFGNQHSAYKIPGGGGRGDANYGVAFQSLDPFAAFDPSNAADLLKLPYFTLAAGTEILGAYLTNTTYAALSMRDGDGFAKKFGGAGGNDPDWFKVTAYGTDESDDVLPASVEFFLADFRFSDNSLDYILDDWTFFNLGSLAGAERVYFHFASSDTGSFGINTPAYFAIDDISVSNPAPEPGTFLLTLTGGIAFVCVRLRRRKNETARLRDI